MTHHLGDYLHQKGGLELLYRPDDLVDFDVHRAELCAGVVAHVPEPFRAPYACLEALADHSGLSLGSYVEDFGVPLEFTVKQHPCTYLWHCLKIQGFRGHMPPLVISAFEEIKTC